MKKSATILIVEDDRSILEGMADLLRLFDIGYDVNVLKAKHGLEGLDVMAQQVPDLIVSDIMMPRMDGFEFLKTVRANRAWVHVPFIFLTAKGKKEDILEGRRSGAELYITKPFVSDELLELIKSQLDRAFQLEEARQQKLNLLKRNILQLLNHEFRTPLTYVTAYYEMLADSLVSFDDTRQLQEYLRGIQVGSARLTNLVEDLITIMEIRTGEAAAVFNSTACPLTDLDRLLRNQGEAYEAVAAREGIALRYNIATPLPPVFGSPVQLADALQRLLDNAVKFTRGKRGGTKEIHLAARASDEHVSLIIEDSGVGFPAHVKDQLFELFFQYDRERFEQQGSGAGLAIARGLVNLHNGQIDVESAVDKGSRFSIILPIYRPQLSVQQANKESPRQSTVLIVEDDKHLLEGLKELLEVADTPYRLSVLTAGHGQEGLKVLETHQPDLIISDVMMPVMGGYEFLSRVRANPAWLQVPFIFLTAKGEREDIHRGRRSGAEEYITKPYNIDELLDLTVTQLDRHFERQGAVSQSFDGLKRSILAMLQPDFKGPLNMVTRYSQKLAAELEQVETDEDLISSLQVIQASSERLTRLVEDFIAMAEFKTGEAATAYELQAAPLSDVSMLLYEAGYHYHSESREDEPTFFFELDHELPPIFCDRQRLLDTFTRLLQIIVECSRMTGHRASIHLISSTRGDEVELTIRVEGTSFSEADCDQIGRFLQEEDRDVLELPHYGPALTVIKNAVELHQGRIALEQEADSLIAFTVVLPAYRPPSG